MITKSQISWYVPHVVGQKIYPADSDQVLDVDLKGVLYTSSLAIQHFRRQKPDHNGFKGKSEGH